MKVDRLERYPIGRLRFRRTHVEQLMKERELSTVKEVANLLQVQAVTIRRMVRDGRLKPYSIGERLRFRREDVHALLGR